MLPTAAHILYIPGAVFVGLVIGFVIGIRAAQARAREEERRRKE